MSSFPRTLGRRGWKEQRDNDLELRGHPRSSPTPSIQQWFRVVENEFVARTETRKNTRSKTVCFVLCRSFLQVLTSAPSQDCIISFLSKLLKTGLSGISNKSFDNAICWIFIWKLIPFHSVALTPKCTGLQLKSIDSQDLSKIQTPCGFLFASTIASLPSTENHHPPFGMPKYRHGLDKLLYLQGKRWINPHSFAQTAHDKHAENDWAVRRRESKEHT